MRPDVAAIQRNLGWALAHEGDLEAAAQHLLIAQQLQPTLVDAYIDLGLVRARQGNRDAAITQFTEALRLNPNNAQAQQHLVAAARQP